MQETVIEIPENDIEDGWQPPVITQQECEKIPKTQSCSDVFYIQYVICILLVTAVFVIRCLDKALFDSIILQFRTQTQAPTEAFIAQLIAFLQSQWS